MELIQVNRKSEHTYQYQVLQETQVIGSCTYHINKDDPSQLNLLEINFINFSESYEIGALLLDQIMTFCYDNQMSKVIYISDLLETHIHKSLVEYGFDYDKKQMMYINEVHQIEDMGAFFDKRAESYDQHMKRTVKDFDHFYDALVLSIKSSNEQVNVLDLGCGTGTELAWLFAKIPNAQVTGIDLSIGMLDMLKEKYHTRLDQIQLVVDSYVTYPYENLTFDYVISAMTMHHFLDDTKIAIYKKIYDALDDHGFYIEGDYVVDKEEEDNCLNYYHGVKKEEGKLYHIDIPFTFEHQKLLLEKAGFKHIELLWQEGAAVVIKANK